MAYYARVERDSISPAGRRLATAVITFPRVVLAEVVTHRCNYESTAEGGVAVLTERTATRDLSKSSASSRAVPVKKMIEAVQADPYVPERFSRAGPGMSEAGWLEGEAHALAAREWLQARDRAVESAERLLALGVHKQDANRLLEPWGWVTQVVTATDDGWHNFFALRCHKSAHPAFRRVARMLYREWVKSTPQPLEQGQWHLPFTGPDDRSEFTAAAARHCPWTGTPVPLLALVSAARCGRVSYLRHDGTPAPLQDDVALCHRFLEPPQGGPPHASPLEHVATPAHPAWEGRPELRSNLTGWLQLRKTVRRERAGPFLFTEEEVASWGDGPA